MSFDDDERSVSQCRPIDLYTIVTPTATYRVTSHVVDVAYGGVTYMATTMGRGNLQVSQDLTGHELVVYLPISHPLVQRFTASGIPEHSVVVTLLRMQQVSGQAIQQWTGFAQSIAIDGHTALIRVPSLTEDAMKVRLPVISAQRLCNHTLYDSLCGIDRFDPRFPVVPPACYFVSQIGNVLAVSTMGGKPDGWAQFGEVIQPFIGQRRMVLSQAGTQLTLNAPLVGVSVGDPLTVFAGCDHSVTTCRDKFNNVINFGGMPLFSSAINPWSLKGLGISTQI